jgi:hypothetical protein
MRGVAASPTSTQRSALRWSTIADGRRVAGGVGGSDDGRLVHDRRAHLVERDGTIETATTDADAGETITLVTYDSFPEGDTSLNDALAEFTADTGIDVEILVAGDTGTMLSKASLTAGNPEGDVMWGIDNTLLSRAIADEVFEPYVAAGIADGSVEIGDEFLALVPDGEATPVDYGDVCVNYDIGWYDERDLDPPSIVRRPDRSGLRRPTGRAESGDVVTRSGVPVGNDPRVRPRRLAGLLEPARRQRRRGRRRLDEAYYERFTWAGGGPDPDGGELRIEPAGRGDLRRPTAQTMHRPA